MMYSAFPRSDRIAIRTTLGSAWFFSAVSGAGGVFIAHPILAEDLGHWLPQVSSYIIFIASFFALLGSLLNRYRVEWVAAWFAAGGGFSLAISLWYLVFTSSPYRLQTAAGATVVLCFYLYRIVSCAAHAKRLRTIHNLTQTGEVILPHAR